jgi:hypothetical protein
VRVMRWFLLLIVSASAVCAQQLTNGPWTYTLNLSNEATITGYSGLGGAVEIPSSLNGSPVRQIGNGWPPVFRTGSSWFNASVTSVVIPSGITRIGYGAFAYCQNLTNVVIPTGVTSIDDYGFYATSLAAIAIPHGVTNIGAHSFQAHPSVPSLLSSVSIPDSVLRVGSHAFESCTTLSNVALGNGLLSLGDWAFSSCVKLTSVNIPDSVGIIEAAAFWGCTNMTNVTIGAGLTNIGVDVFSRNFRLQSVHFKGNVPLVGGAIFAEIEPVGTVYYLAGTANWGPTFSGWPTQPDSLSPSLVVEQPAGTELSNNAPPEVGEACMLGREGEIRVFRARNSGNANLGNIVVSKSGADSSHFLLTAPTTDSLAPGASTTFSVSFAPTSSGSHTAQLSVVSNDTNNSPFIINLSGFGLGEDLDTDGDGLNDAAEFTMSSLGFDWQSSQPTLVTALYSNANRAQLFTQSQYDDNRARGREDGRAEVIEAPGSYGLYDSTSIMELRMGGLMIQKQGTDATIVFQPQTTTDLVTLPFTNNGTPITNTVPMPGDKGFLRVEAIYVPAGDLPSGY